jgi:hypothetical protein
MSIESFEVSQNSLHPLAICISFPNLFENLIGLSEGKMTRMAAIFWSRLAEHRRGQKGRV